MEGLQLIFQKTSDEKLNKLVDQIAKQENQGIAQNIAWFIVQEEETRFIRQIIATEYKYNNNEMKQIEYYCAKFGQTESEIADRLQLIETAISLFLEENDTFVYEGFVRFRLANYMNALRDLVKYAIDEYVVEKQYQEFISLLQYFVYIQDAKMPVAHLIHKGQHEFEILNEKLEPIETSVDDSVTLEMVDREINFEDMVVSALIIASPQQIYVHTREPDMQVISTILQIFEERATLCTCCQVCKPALGGKSNGTSIHQST